MSKISNQRLDRRKEKEVKLDNDFKKTLKEFKTGFSNMSIAIKIYFLVFVLLNLASMILIGIFCASIVQAIAFVGLMIFDIASVIIFKKVAKPTSKVFMRSIALFMALLCCVSTLFTLYGQLGWGQMFSIKSQIKEIEKTCDKVVSTPLVDVYVNLNDKKVYSISNIADQKYINESTFSIYEESEYSFLYNVGIQLNTEIDGVKEIYLYPPTPNTVTGYEYLLELDYESQKYVAKVFIPGIVEFPLSAKAQMFALTYKSSDERFYIVSKFDKYLLFQSEYSSFSTPFENVKYTSEKEYFYVRYNRYLEAFYGDEVEYEEIGEKNVRFISSYIPMSTVISKVNFFWVGIETNGKFTATLPVIEIVYIDNTCDIAVIKDVVASDIKSVVTHPGTTTQSK